MQNNFTIKLMTLLKKKSLSQKDLANLLCAKEPLISRWLTGKAKPTNTSVIKLCKALNLPINYFDDVSSVNSGIINNGNNNSNHLNDELQDEKIKRLELEIELLKVRIEKIEKMVKSF